MNNYFEYKISSINDVRNKVIIKGYLNLLKYVNGEYFHRAERFLSFNFIIDRCPVTDEEIKQEIINLVKKFNPNYQIINEVR